MARFYASAQGSRGAVHRLGGSHGCTALAAGWQGGIEVYAYDKDGEDWARVSFITWRGAGIDRLIYEGPINGKKPVKRKKAKR